LSLTPRRSWPAPLGGISAGYFVYFYALLSKLAG
jgi:hypothetical protein